MDTSSLMSRDLARHLALALSAQDVFGSEVSQTRQMEALKQKVKSSQTPLLMFLPMLLKDASVTNSIERFAGRNSLKALMVAAAPKPRKKKESKRRSQRKKELEREAAEKEARRIEEAAKETHLPQPVKGKRRQSIASFLGTARSSISIADKMNQAENVAKGKISVNTSFS